MIFSPVLKNKTKKARLKTRKKQKYGDSSHRLYYTITGCYFIIFLGRKFSITGWQKIFFHIV